MAFAFKVLFLKRGKENSIYEGFSLHAWSRFPTLAKEL
jgi:hypothetical protein